VSCLFFSGVCVSLENFVVSCTGSHIVAVLQLFFPPQMSFGRVGGGGGVQLLKKKVRGGEGVS
jgi:hypothetical protein